MKVANLILVISTSISVFSNSNYDVIFFIFCDYGEFEGVKKRLSLGRREKIASSTSTAIVMLT